MSQKNETPILVLSLLITIALIAGGIWWFNKRFAGIDNNSNNINNTNTPASKASGTNFATVQNVPTGLFNYGGSTSWAPIRVSVDSQIRKERPEF